MIGQIIAFTITTALLSLFLMFIGQLVNRKLPNVHPSQYKDRKFKVSKVTNRLFFSIILVVILGLLAYFIVNDFQMDRRGYVLLMLGSFFILGGLLAIYESSTEYVEIKNGIVTFKRFWRTKQFKLTDIKNVYQDQGYIKINLFEKKQISIPFYFEESPLLIEMLKNYRKTSG